MGWKTVVKWVVGGAVKKVISALDFGKVVDTVQEVEEEYPGSGLSTVKRRVAVQMLMEAIDIPYLSEDTERRLWGFLVSAVVDVLNNKSWKKKSEEVSQE